MKIDQLMTPDPVTLGSRASLRRALDELRLGRIRHLPIVDGGELVGLLSERDLHAVQDSELDDPIREHMSSDVQTVAPGTDAHEAAYLILRHAIGCVPVTDDRGHLLGIVTDTDFVRAAYSLLGGTVPVDELEVEEREADSV